MLNLFRAEWKKTIGNRWVAGCMLGIFPVGAAVAFVVILFAAAVAPGFRERIADQEIPWTDPMLGVWSLSWFELGRLLLAGFTAVLFAGEYQWGTWKSIIPRNNRIALLLIKYLTLGAVVVTTFAVMSVIALVGIVLLNLIAGAPIQPHLTGHVLADFIGDYATQIMLAFLSTLIVAGYTALVAMVTRSMVGGVLVGVGAVLLEVLILPLVLGLVAYFLNLDSIVKVLMYLPFYNLYNINSWLMDGHAYVQDGEFSRSLAFSFVMLFTWVFGLIGLTAFIFRRQDITS
jgi:hypothetical protein